MLKGLHTHTHTTNNSS